MRENKQSWQEILAKGFKNAEELLKFLHLPISMANPEAQQQFKTRLPRPFAELMEPENPYDPLLRQVLALPEETYQHPDFDIDPLQEQQANPVSGLIHKYPGRVLLTLTGTCAINCRYCFRRHFPYQENNPGRRGLEKVFDYIRQDESLHEVILSGGDPLLATDQILADVISKLQHIQHVKTVRFHTRIPVVLPERITDTFLTVLASSKLNIVMVLHSNHERELDNRVLEACRRLRGTDCHLLNQSVLLRGVNDNVKTLAALSYRLFACGVLPYYLHQLDKVQGAAHFEVPHNEGQNIYQTLQQSLPGYLVPRYVIEEPYKSSKTLLS